MPSYSAAIRLGQISDFAVLAEFVLDCESTLPHFEPKEKRRKEKKSKEKKRRPGERSNQSDLTVEQLLESIRATSAQTTA